MELPEWSDAVCASIGGDFWFPEVGESDVAKFAKQVCQGCPIQEPCLEYAIAEHTEVGIWGGLTGRERVRLRLSREAPEHLV